MSISKKQHDKHVKKYSLEVVEKEHILGLIKENETLLEKSTQEELAETETFRIKEIEAELSSIIKSVVIEENPDKIEGGLLYSDVYTIEKSVEVKENDIEKSFDEDGKEIAQDPISVYRDTQMNRSLERVGEKVEK
jgi:hypothetical protein